MNTSRVDNLEKIEIIDKKKMILSVGRLTKQKNFSYLINEFKKFREYSNDYFLYIVGEGERNSLEVLIKNNFKKMFFARFKKNIFSYEKSEIFILSSLWEEVGFAMVEAAFYNNYLVCSNCPNGPSEFLNYGKNGLLFKNNTKDLLYKSLIDYDKLNLEKIYKDKVELKKCIKVQ